MDYIKMISASEDLKEDIVRKYIDLDWDFNEIFHNRNISDKFIVEYSYKFPGLSINGKNVTEYVTEYQIKEKAKKDYKQLTKTTNIVDIMEFPVIIWDWDWLTRNTDIQIISKYVEYGYWKWEILSEITEIETVVKYKNIMWDWEMVSLKANKEYVIKYPGLKWNLCILSRNKDIVQNVKLKWNYWYISIQPWLDLDYVSDNWNENWDWDKLVSKFTLEELKNIHQTKIEKNNSLIGLNNECMICLDSIENHLESLENNNENVVLKCLHQYHQICLVKWLYKQNSCPLCKTPIENDKFLQWMYRDECNYNYESESESDYESDMDDWYN